MKFMKIEGVEIIDEKWIQSNMRKEVIANWNLRINQIYIIFLLELNW